MGSERGFENNNPESAGSSRQNHQSGEVGIGIEWELTLENQRINPVQL